jgi:hypothetical protein
LHGLFFNHEDNFLQNVGWLSRDYMVLYPRSEVHKIPACVQCTVQVCELAVSNLHPPPYRSRQIMCLSHSESVRPPLTSYMPGRSIPCTHSSTHHRTLCAVHGLCTSVLDDITFHRLNC